MSKTIIQNINVSGMKMKVPIQARMFDLQQVRYLDGPFKDATEKV
jgi:hypothetical protein